MNRETCSTCAHWHLMRQCQRTKVAYGDCRRYPPSVGVTVLQAPNCNADANSFWPETAQHMWCGEHWKRIDIRAAKATGGGNTNTNE